MVLVEKGIPYEPPPVGGRKKRGAKWPFESMEIGDSFFIPDRSTKTISNSCAYWQDRLPGRIFRTRKVQEKGREGVRIWRVE